MPRYTAKPSKSRNKKILILSFVLLIAAAIVLLILELTNTTYIFHKKTVPATIPVSATADSKKSASSAIKPNNGSTNNNSAVSNSDSQSNSDKVAGSSAGATSGSSQTLIQPYGSFVSNHKPGQNGSPTQEQSVCATTPDAVCYIQFTNVSSGKTTKLPNQTAGSDGSTVWSWNANILTSGNWKITAIANLNGQTKSSTDTLELEIE